MSGWVRAKACGNSAACIEVRPSLNGPGLIVIRDSILPDIKLVTSTAAWAAFVAGVKAGDFDNLEDK